MVVSTSKNLTFWTCLVLPPLHHGFPPLVLLFTIPLPPSGFWVSTWFSLRKECVRTGLLFESRCKLRQHVFDNVHVHFKAVFFLRIAWSSANCGTKASSPPPRPRRFGSCEISRGMLCGRVAQPLHPVFSLVGALALPVASA